jgi:hypothetical protein
LPHNRRKFKCKFRCRDCRALGSLGAFGLLLPNDVARAEVSAA